MRSWFIAIALSAVLSSTAYAQAAAPVENKPEAKPEKEVITSTGENTLKPFLSSGGMTKSSVILEAPLSDDFVMGDRKAPVVLIDYVSMTCPHCAHFTVKVMPEIEKKYVETGKVAYILRQFPLNEPALKAALLLHCVGEQDPKRYFIFSKVLFDAQNKWAFDPNYLAGLETISSVGGLSKEQFAGCLNNTDREMRVLNIKKIANDELKLPHTPYIFIDGEVYSGERTVEAVSQFIDLKLANKR
ncbi:MAG: DsbA family protein [Rickettsiales bacterium]|nr:DsbA family protein [Rickettsiales bacterium]